MHPASVISSPGSDGASPRRASKLPGRPPPRVRGSRQRAQLRVLAGTPVLDAGAGDVHDGRNVLRARRCSVAAALRIGCGCGQTVLPLLLVPAVLERHVEWAHTLQGASADGHVGAPRIPRVGCPLCPDPAT